MLHYETKGGNPIEIESPDGSVKVTREGEVVQLSIDLVTEHENGLARAFDKKVLDHSLHNVVPFGAHTDEDSAVQELTEVDRMYAPKMGQMLDWMDEDGNYHLSRYSYDPNFQLPVGSQWSSVVYDDVHDTICVLSFGANDSGLKEGDFFVCTRDVRGVWKQIGFSSYETWFQLSYGNGIIVAMSGNSSREFAVSRDGGFTWDFGVLPTENRYIRVRFISGKFYFICGTGYYASQDMTNFDEFVNVTDLLDITERDGGLVYLTGNTSQTIYYIDEAPIEGTRKVFSGHKPFNAFYYVGNGVYFAYCDFGLYTTDNFNNKVSLLGLLDYDITPNDGNLAENHILLQTFSPLEEVIMKKEDDLVKLYTLTSKISSGASFVREFLFQPSQKSVYWVENQDRVYYNYATHACIVREDYLFVVVGGSRDGGNRSATNSKETSIWDCTDLSRTTIEFNPWEEIPLITEKNEGIIFVKDKKVGEVVLSDFLKLRENTLETIHSDRYTEYQNYLLTRVSGGVEESVWCPVALDEIEDGTTSVYDDEGCTNVVGTIIEHDYNPNNPTDVEVSIDGNTYVYTFHTSKTPLSLATTKALIDSFNEIRRLLANYRVGKSVYIVPAGQSTPVEVTGITYNSSTGSFEKTISNNIGDQIYVTTDGLPPQMDMSNICLFYTCVSASGAFVSWTACLYTDGTRTAPIFITV